MSRLNPVVLAVLFMVFIALYGGMTWFVGGLYLDAHEGDSYHFVDILLRMADGQVPHLDFVTPLGVLTFLPISLLMQAGFELGQATILAQIAVAGALVPFVVYVCGTRLSGGAGLLFGLFTLGLTLSLSYGTANSGVAISMHYNRWAWSISFVMLALAIVPARTERPSVDGAIVGVLCGVLLLLKVTYFVTLVPVAAVALAARGGVRPVLSALLGGLVVIGVATVYLTPAFWMAYLHDIMVVTGSDIRPFVGVPFNEILVGPAHISATLVGVAAIYLIRKSAYDAAKTAIVLFLPAVIYISYQNFANDPQWLLFLPVLLLALRPEEGFDTVLGFDLRRAMETTALLAVAVFFPSLFNIAMSPVEHMAFDRERFVPMLPAETGHQDIFIREDRGYTMTARVLKDQEEGGPWSIFEERAERPPEPVFEGISFPTCEWMAGARGYFDVLTADLNRSGIPEGSRLFTADILTAFWMFGPYQPPENGAPWYYGDVSGLENSDYVIIPKCGFVDRVRAIMIDDLTNSGHSFELVRNNELYAMFAVN